MSTSFFPLFQKNVSFLCQKKRLCKRPTSSKKFVCRGSSEFIQEKEKKRENVFFPWRHVLFYLKKVVLFCCFSVATSMFFVCFLVENNFHGFFFFFLVKIQINLFKRVVLTVETIVVPQRPPNHHKIHLPLDILWKNI